VRIRDTKPFLDEHAQLRDHVEHLPVAARELPHVSTDERVEMVERIVAFLSDMLLPHAAAEERVLYPEAALLLGEEDASDTVASDRAQVRELLQRLAEAEPDDVGTMQETMFALHALLLAHVWREEEVYVKLARRAGDAGRVILDRVAAAEARGRRFRRGDATG
jgi:hemerythrin superfamily protein